MKNLFKIIIAINLVICNLFFAQNRVEDFNISFPEKSVENSLYNSIKIIDARIDKSNLGIVQKGAFNNKAKVVPTIGLNKQFQNLFIKINGENAQNGELVLYLKQLSFAEITGTFKETGYCYFQAILFNKTEGEKYQLLDKIDSVIEHSSMDVTKATMRKGSEMITDFIVRNIDKKNSEMQEFTYNDIQNFDQIEKVKFALYSNEILQDGMYESFEDFRDQKPSLIQISEVKTIGKDDRIIKVYNQVDGKEKLLKSQDYFAMVYQSSPYIYSFYDRAFVKLNKREDGDFYFTGRIKTNAKTGDVMLAFAFFGIIGGLIASNATATFESKLDYSNGAFIPIKEVKK